MHTILLSQEHFNKLIDFGYQRNSIYAVHTEGSKILIHGNVLASDTANVNEIFYAELLDDASVSKFVSLNRSSYMTNNLMNDLAFQDGEYINSFHESKRAFLYKISEDYYEVIDSFTNPLNNDRPIQITEYYNDKDGDLWFSGGYSEIISNPPLVYRTKIFITKLIDPSISLEVKNPIPNASGGILVPMSTGYLFKTIVHNSGLPTPEGWGSENYFYKVSNNGIFSNLIKTEPSDQLGTWNDIHVNDDDSFIISGLEAKKDPNSSGKVIRPIVYKFSFEKGIEWKVYPYGPEWSTSFEKVTEIIPAMDGDGYIVVGENYTTDSLGTYNAGTLSKISTDGSLEWVKYYNSGHQAFHHTYDVHHYLDGYIIVGNVFNFEDGLPGEAHIYGWIVYVNNEGEFDQLSSDQVRNVKAELNLRLYPNPTGNTLYIKETIIEQEPYDRLVIANIYGQSVMEVYNLESHIDISSLQSGNYIVSFYKEGKQVGTEKFSKY